MTTYCTMGEESDVAVYESGKGICIAWAPGNPAPKYSNSFENTKRDALNFLLQLKRDGVQVPPSVLFKLNAEMNEEGATMSGFLGRTLGKLQRIRKRYSPSKS